MSVPAFSVVMPTYNRREGVVRAVSALAAQRCDAPFEIVVVVDGSEDDTEEHLGELMSAVPVRVFRQPNQGPAVARNLGVERALGELIVFVDDDVVAAPGMLQAHLDAHRRLGPDVVVIGPMLDPPDFDMAPWVRWEQAMLRKQYAAMDAGEYAATARQFYTGNASIERAHVLAAGGFDATFRRAEDVELAYRLDDRGLRFEFVPEAVSHHYADRSFAAWKDVAYAYGRNDVVFARDRGRTWIFPFMARKYRLHHVALRGLIDSCVRCPVLRRISDPAFAVIARVADRFGVESLTRYAYSAVYGVAYHMGIRDELGGAKQFRDVVRAT